MLLDKFENKYIIKGILETRTPIHIGTGNQSFDPIDVDNAVIKDRNGNPFIPGSSLKGVLRSFMERLLQSGFDEKYKSCIVVSSPCLDAEAGNAIKEKHGNNYEEAALEIYDKTCDVCRIFGSNNLAAKLQIKDLKLKEGSRAYLERRDGVAIDRDTGVAADNKKYTFETVSSGTSFEFYMTIDNLDKEHEELLKVIIAVLKGGELKIGGKTSAGLGDVQLVDDKIYKVTRETLKDFVLKGVSDEMRWNYVS